MGINGDIVPDEGLRRIYELEFSILRAAARPLGEKKGGLAK